MNKPQHNPVTNSPPPKRERKWVIGLIFAVAAIAGVVWWAIDPQTPLLEDETLQPTPAPTAPLPADVATAIRPIIPTTLTGLPENIQGRWHINANQCTNDLGAWLMERDQIITWERLCQVGRITQPSSEITITTTCTGEGQTSAHLWRLHPLPNRLIVMMEDSTTPIVLYHCPAPQPQQSAAQR